MKRSEAKEKVIKRLRDYIQDAMIGKNQEEKPLELTPDDCFHILDYIKFLEEERT